MRKIPLLEPETPEWEQWKCQCAGAREAAIAAAAAGENVAISALYKAQKEWFRDTGNIFFGKCAYCELNIVENQRGDVEHYRPKAGVQHEDGIWVQRDSEVGPVRHPGYYWLAYDIQNLLLSCIICNQLGAEPKIGKGNRFPVFGDHAWEPGGEAEEAPKLLNPYVDDPREHLRFDPETGLLLALTERGQTTVDVFGLNARDLPRQRLHTYESVLDKFYSILARKRDQPAGWASEQFNRLKDDRAWNFTSVVHLALSKAASDLIDEIGGIGGHAN